MIKSLTNSSISNTQDYRSMLAGTLPSNEYLIGTTILESNTPSVTFDVSSFAGIYRHLQIVAVARSDRAGDGGDSLMIRLNGDNGNNYTRHRLVGNGSVATSAANSAVNSMYVGDIPAPTSNTAIFGASIIDILDSYSTTKNKTMRAFSGANYALPDIRLSSGLFLSTAAINSITIFANIGPNFLAGSRFSLYGVTA